MCGIAGIWAPRLPIDASIDVAQKMTRALQHRGPDGHGHWHDEERGGPVLGHRRLAILDLTPAGAQPMLSRCRRFAITYNGEIYNFREIAEELRQHGITVRTRCDTEVLVEAIARWGVRGAIARAVGMFAFAVWDREERRLVLARDRFGIKPLYLRVDGTSAMFASELGALQGSGVFAPTVDAAAVDDLLRFGFVPAPSTILEGVRKLQPGTICEIRFAGERMCATDETYWSAVEVADASRSRPLASGDVAIVDEIQAALTDAVLCRTIADVPVGALLSGGIDSAVVVASLGGAATTPLYTFTVANDDPRYDESAPARELAERIGTQHVELRVRPEELLAVVQDLPTVYSEPFADYSQIPTIAVCRKARDYVKVVLTGDGGDEVFAGYNRHRWVPRLERALAGVPAPLRRMAGAALQGVPNEAWNWLNSVGGNRVPRLLSSKMRKLGVVVERASAAEMYEELVSVNSRARHLMNGPTERTEYRPPFRAEKDPTDALLLADTQFYLPDDILTKVDRASMSVGLEARVPLLDHRLFELAWRLPARAKLRGNESKWVLRRVIERTTGKPVARLPKQGFGAPVDDWLRGPLREWAGDLLASSTLASHGLLRPSAVGTLWRDHLSGRVDLAPALWPVLMFQAWHDATLR